MLHARQPLVLLPVLRTAFPRMHSRFTAAASAGVQQICINTQKCSAISHTELKVSVIYLNKSFRYGFLYSVFSEG